MAECPGCGNTITLSSKVKVGDRVECPECGDLLEVISVRPLELDYAFYAEDSQDWEDEEWEEEED